MTLTRGENPQLTPGSASQAIPLAELVELELLQRMLREQFIYKSVHPDDTSLVLLCYTPLAQIKGKWNSATTLTRGLIVRAFQEDLSDAVVLQRPWGKFFTLNQHETGWHLGDEENPSSVDAALDALDFNAPAAVYDKVDGSLGILYRAPDGLPALATKGSFSSEQAISYTRLLRENELYLAAAEELLALEDITVLFELVGPKNRIVLKYDQTELILLGGSIKSTGASVLPEELSAWAERGLPVAQRMAAGTLAEALALPPRESREGLVISIGGERPLKLKLKQEDYARLHRIVTMFSKRESRNLVFELEGTYADLLEVAATGDVAYFKPIREVLELDGFSKGDESYEFIRARRESYFKEILLPRAEAIQKAKEVVDSLDQSYFEGESPQKRFAQQVNSLSADRSSLFVLYRARLEGKKMEELNAFQELRRAVRDVKDAKS